MSTGGDGKPELSEPQPKFGLPLSPRAPARSLMINKAHNKQHRMV
jgi:hypothetical protein